jgi:RNA polymerase sigma-70 factor (ECF subfamily)
MDEGTWLAGQFEEHRDHLKAVAYRILGSPSEADDAVQEAWLRFSRSDTGDVRNLRSWLTTVVSRVCLNMLQSRRSRPETLAGTDLPEPAGPAVVGTDPEQEALLADSLGLALLVVLDRLGPAERVALVLHDMFGVSFEQVARVLGRSAPAARQLASRARRRVRGQEVPDDGDRLRQARLVEAFLAASREGDFTGLLAVLDPDVVLRADASAVALGAVAEARGAQELVARFGAGRARGARPALVDGEPAAVWIQDGRLRVVFSFTCDNDVITGIDLIADPARLNEMTLVLPDLPA